MSTGIEVQDDVVSKFQDLKIKKNARYLILGTDDTSSFIEVKVTGDVDKDYRDALEELPKDDPRYLLIDFHYTFEDGNREKLILITWIPDTSKIKKKMIYASTKAAVKQALSGINFEIQATDASEIDYNAVLDKCRSLSR